VSEDRGFAHIRQVTVAALLALAAESILLRAFSVSESGGGILLAVHLAIVGVLWLWYRYSPGIRTDARLPLLLIGTTAALGPVGPAGTLVTMLLARRHMRRTTPFEEWYGALFPEIDREGKDEFALTVADSDLEGQAGLAPFSEILAFGSFHQKQALIALIGQSFRPLFGPILKRALLDDSNAVRVQAATAMNKIEDRMHARTIELRRPVTQDPEDLEALRALALHYDQCLYSRILDGHREEETRDLALEAYRPCIDARPDDLETRIAISRLLLRAGKYEEAVLWLAKVSQEDGVTSQARLWYMESLYNLGRFAELRAYAGPHRNQIEGSDDLPSSALDAVRMWAAADIPLEQALPE
jgi:hypothetical protein